MWQKVLWFFVIIACLVEAQVEVSNKILSTLKDELGYESILVLQNRAKSCEINLSLETVTPTIYFNEQQKLSIKPLFNRRFLALVCLNKFNFGTLKALYINLDKMRDTPTIFLVKKGVNLKNLFKKCFKNRMLNVVAIEHTNQELIHSYQAFPRFGIIKRNISELGSYFEPQLRDMGGYPIISMPDNVLPRDVVYKDAMGHYQLTGYLVSFLKNFVSTLNATMKINWDNVELDSPDETIGWEVTRDVTKGLVDIPLCIVNIGSSAEWQKLIASHVMEISQWQLMLPVEPEIDGTLVIFAGGSSLSLTLVNIAILMIALLLHNTRRLEQGENPNIWCLCDLFDTVLRAILYQTFVLRRRPSRRLIHIYIVLFALSFFAYNVYNAQLETMLLHPLREPPIRSYQDLRRAGITILTTHDEGRQMMSILGRKHMIEFWNIYDTVNISVFQEQRRLPNSSFAYPITQTLWPLIEHKFIKQPRKKFRLSNDFMFISLLPFGLPLPKNSIYEQALNQYILRTHSSGLYAFWFRQSFQSLVEIGKMEVLPYMSIKECYHILIWRDLYYVWIIYSGYIGICILAFIIEVVYYHANR